MDWSIRVASAADAADVARLNEVVQGLHHRERPDWFKPPDASAFQPTVDGWLASASVRIFLAETVGGEPVGYAIGRRHERPDDALRHGASIVELDQVVVDPAARRRGVGRDLCRAVVDWAAAEGAARVELGTWAFNDTAQRVFEGLGFRPTIHRMSVETAEVHAAAESDATARVDHGAFDPGVFDEGRAPHYDERHAEMFDEAVLGPTVDVLVGLAGDGRALELASGTGRVALPLSARGVEVHGIELSRPMVDQMLAKPGAERVAVTIGDMATTRVAGTFRLVYLVFNTIGNLLTQDEQVACFANAAAHLEPGGCFVVELVVPELRRLAPGERHVLFAAEAHHLGVDEYDVVDQRLVSHHHWIDDAGGVTRTSTPQRYAWPAELDLMARLAGLQLRHRWGDWDRRPFTADSPSHVSVWAKP